jgi:hypothetical protein
MYSDLDIVQNLKTSHPDSKQCAPDSVVTDVDAMSSVPFSRQENNKTTQFALE